MNTYPPLHPTDADFAAIRRRGGFYVDKTGLFRNLLETDPGTMSSLPLTSRHQFMARPRRFGKTLLINTLEAWFQGLPPGHRANPEGVTAPLDGLPEGWTSPPWLWDGLDAADWHGTHGWHPVIRLDLSQLAGTDPAGTHAALRDYMEDTVWLWTDRSTPWTSAWTDSLLDSGPERILRNLIRHLGVAYGSRPVVLVDEYDAPITEHLGTDADPTPAVGALRRFFRVLKDDVGLLYGVFATGITRFARSHLFSAANNFVDISDEPRYGALCGFTEEETDRYLAPYREALADMEPRLAPPAIQTAWRNIYNGYRFSPLPSAPRVYNPFTLTNGVSRVLAEPDRCRQAADGTWPSVWSESGHPGLIARLAADTRQALPEGGAEDAPEVGLRSLTRPDYATLMLETGYYTWHGRRDDGKAHLNFPNLEVAESWTRDILGLGAHAPSLHETLIPELRACLLTGDVDGFARRLEIFYSGLAHQNLDSEACFRSVLQTLCLMITDDVHAEKSTWGGRSDLELGVGDRIYVMEVKHGGSAAEALRQIQDRPYGREHLPGNRQALAVGLAFRKDGDRGVHLDCRHRDLRTLLRERDSDTAADTKPSKGRF
ncbi:MAG: AAA family ATPase [Gemmatimonadetes bacterium]|nr:AAA family ATPase [Gemmatimonadota bacterium]